MKPVEMAYLNVKMPETQVKFDWDDIDVGNNQLDHSENFFAMKHFEHERLNEMDLLQNEMAKTELTNIEEQCVHYKIEKSNNTTVAAVDEEDKENLEVSLHSNKENNNSIKEDRPPSPADVKEEPHDDVGPESHLNVSAKPTKIVKPNIACQWSSQKPPISTKFTAAASTSKGAVSKSMPPPPQAYLVKDIYQKKREEAERRRAEEERKRREFHSRPAPNFNSYHQLMEKRKPAHALTVAVTPQVLKKSKETDEKRRKRLEEWKQKSQTPKFESRPPTVLKEKPFVPEKKPLVIQQCPFNLHTEKRLAVRKHYDETKHKALVEKRKQVEIEEEERKRREEERIRELRKATTFKARPNPFKN